MKFIKIDETNLITYVHNFPDMLSDDEKQDGYLISDIPNPQKIEGKAAHPYYNPVSGEIHFEYVDYVSPAPEVDQTIEIAILKNQVVLMQEAIDDLILGGMI